MTNNKRKIKHIPKFTRHWKVYLKLPLSDAELKYAMTDVEELQNLISRLMDNIIDQYTEYLNNHRPEWWDGYGFIKEDKPII